jgi:hypothetical protein
MTDFLTRLAQRTLGLAPVVQPRIASLYAPATEVMISDDQDFSPSPFTAVDPTSESTPVTAELITTPTAPESLNVRSSQISNSENLRLPLPQMDAPSPSELPLISPLVTNAGQTSSPVTPDTLQDFTSNSSIGQNSDPASSPLIDPFEEPRNNFENSRSPVSIAASSSTPSTRETNQNPSLTQSNSENQPTTLLNQPSPTTEANRSPLVPPILLRRHYVNGSDLSAPSKTDLPEFTPAIPPQQQSDRRSPGVDSPPASLLRAASTAMQSSPQPEPIIEIQIGRIEVKTTPSEPAKSRPKSASATPALSLSDYLNQREGGKK